jgi:hypothetical protein
MVDSVGAVDIRYQPDQLAFLILNPSDALNRGAMDRSGRPIFSNSRSILDHRRYDSRTRMVSVWACR